jgi:uncharacterized protein YbcI
VQRVSFEDVPEQRRAPLDGDGSPTPSPTPLTRVTRAMVAIYKDQFGRGPRHAHSHFTGPDAITCFLEGSLTPVERTLVELGEHQRLRDIRLLFQYAAEDSFRSAVEGITGRRVIAFTSGLDTEADISSETFVLEPLPTRKIES